MRNLLTLLLSSTAISTPVAATKSSEPGDSGIDIEFEARRGKDFVYKAMIGDRKPPLD